MKTYVKPTVFGDSELQAKGAFPALVAIGAAALAGAATGAMLAMQSRRASPVSLENSFSTVDDVAILNLKFV